RGRRAGLRRSRVPPLTPPCPPVPAVLVGRAPRKALGSSSSVSAGPPLPGRRGDRRPVGLNRVCVRPVPAWQRGIGDFLKPPSKEHGAPDGDTPGTSGLEARALPLDPAEDGECSEEE
ncbi:PAF15 factor, partial [Pachycephala philippinensis]|nr:PAF15 factor [Pachycephala philippinensis]